MGWGVFMDFEPLVGPAEVANMLGISVKTVRAKHKRLCLPHYKVGWLVKYRLSEIEEWLLKRRREKKIPEIKVVRKII